LPEPYYAGEFTAGNYGGYRPTLDISGPLTQGKSLQYRLNAAYQRDGSFRDFFIDQDRIFTSPALSWHIGPRTTLTLDMEYLDETRQFDRGLVAIDGRVADIPDRRYLGERFSTYDASQIQGRYLLQHTFTDVWSLRSTARVVSTNDHRFSADPLAIEDNNRTLSRRAQNQEDDAILYTLQNEATAKFQTGFLRHKMLVGLELLRNDFKNFFQFADQASIDIFDPVYGAEPGLFAPKNRNEVWLNVVGVYIQDEVSLGEKWRLRVGGRYDHVHGKSTFRSDENGFAETVSAEDNAFSPRVGVVYQPIPTVSFYANYAQSFVSQLGTTFEGTPFKPEQGEQ
jgi:iron complex outermembrane recepter protein